MGVGVGYMQSLKPNDVPCGLHTTDGRTTVTDRPIPHVTPTPIPHPINTVTTTQPRTHTLSHIHIYRSDRFLELYSRVNHKSRTHYVLFSRTTTRAHPNRSCPLLKTLY